ncbi:glucose dehydrogenase [FAD, quinone]-like [Bacillus rossius redtenbacheri]|uniref:glucose dehydrogenase [FAD, quinone]-like n=1 Tax=Bacillus rossius redtenbacheri TaxID=93214 RepID=UPI002FDD0388
MLRMKGATCLALLLLLARRAAPQTPGVISSFLNILQEGVTQADNEPRDEPTVSPEYDFIVVGAGSAGCVVANRLTEVPDWTVLLIEAGREENYVMDVPIIANYLQFSEANWKYKTEPSDAACLGHTNRRCNWPRGKVMGGSSVLNYMIYTRGNWRDYDNWRSMGNDGWGFDDVLPYFLKSEDNNIEGMATDSRYHSKGGYLSVSNIPFHTSLADAFIRAGLETGARVVDYNGRDQVGFSYLQVTMKNGTRWSSSRAFLHPASSRSNLHVKKYSLVTRILIDPRTRTAYGVEFTNKGKTYRVKAKREVILSAGAINSPQVLMLSGIGPREHLEKLKVPVVNDLKVGYNLMDHIALGGLTFLCNHTSLRTFDLIQSSKNFLEFFSYHRGPFSVPGGCEALAYYDLKNPGAADGYPDVELLFQGGSIVSDPTLRRNFGIDDALYERVYKRLETENTWMMLPMLLRPKSRGRIMLRDANPGHKPLIYHNYYAAKEDLDTMVGAIKKTVELSQTAAMRNVGSRLHDVKIPGCARFQFGSDEYWGCAARHLTFTIYHQSGTCKMGPAGDPSAVVDPRLRVHGVARLRVVDASIMPVIPIAHTNAPTYMIAEKASDMIKEDWGRLAGSQFRKKG